METLNEITVTYKRDTTDASLCVRSSSSAYELCRKISEVQELQLDLREYFYIVLLNRANQVIGYYQLSSGGISGTVADPRLAFGIAMKCMASGIILWHNHPSGTLRPSQADLQLTQKFSEAGKLLDCPVLDHLILTSEGYYSFADEGKL